ncbi:DUF1269 domain-containing protein [Nocardioides mangrovi]|uniref:DUF1269 domain-containing protein n=1 Tax=Nocardioides mangrovi TaxID=2874580 RepID=A0ABS7UC46_9ACTN|nr:DUF1269 domain-containing protein [Nocardioides mangrovi]MBZ5738238.1 DUF1269 domain-containing protein [Nocardioides mangrovi]
MATLTAWRFDRPDTADRAARLLQGVGPGDPPIGHAAAVVAWPAHDRRPLTRTLEVADPGALGDGFWGLLFGLVFFVPLLGAALGAPTGALAGSLADVGIDDHFVNRLRDRVTPGTSALVVLAPDLVVDRLQAALADGPRAELIRTDLDPDHEAALRAVFGG